MASAPPSVVPAQLAFLAIYNPSLGTTDDTLDDQIVYYYSASAPPHARRDRRRARRHGASAGAGADGSSPSPPPGPAAASSSSAAGRGVVGDAQRNERLRQIGLAQGMVEFGRSFSGGKPVDTVDTEKSRVVMRELEPGWWILAVGSPFSHPIFFFFSFSQ